MKHKLIAIELCESDIKNMCGRYHFKDADLALLAKVYRECFSIREVSVYYMEYFGYNDGKAGGRGMEKHKSNSIAVLMTLGQTVDECQSRMMAEGLLLEAYAVECLSMEILNRAYGKLERLLEMETGMRWGRYLFPGSDGALEENKRILSAFEQSEVSCNDAYALIPQKSVVYIMEEQKREMYVKTAKMLAETTKRAEKACEAERCSDGKQETTEPQETQEKKLCDSCTKTDCPNRMAADSREKKTGKIKLADTNYNYGYQRIFGKPDKNR